MGLFSFTGELFKKGPPQHTLSTLVDTVLSAKSNEFYYHILKRNLSMVRIRRFSNIHMLIFIPPPM